MVKQLHTGMRGAAFVRSMVSILLILVFASSIAVAQDELNVIKGESSNNSWLEYSDAPNALYHHIAGQAYDLLDERADEIAGLHSRSEWQARQEEVRETLMEIVGPFPEKTPVNADVVNTIDKEGYRVEHVVYESQPAFYVTSSLFIPDGAGDAAPAVIYASGHTEEGYRSSTYQHVILNLVDKGFIVLAIDPVGQGERLEYVDEGAGGSVVGVGTREHSYSGAQAFITGSSLARYMTWDGIRAVDYLSTRDEVDTSRLGITGRSGGGTQAALIAAFDERIHAAAPEAYITNFTRLLQSIGPQDAEQNLFHGIARGIDHADFLVARAPKPALMVATTEDFFSIQGARETAQELSDLYEAYGEATKFDMVEDGGGHRSTRQNREAMYAFFQEHLNNPGDSSDKEIEPLSEEEIQVTSTGQIATSYGGETVFSLNRQEAEDQMSELRASREDLSAHVSNVLDSAKELSGYQEPEEVDAPVFTGRIQRDGYAVEKYFVEGEGDYVIPFLLLLPEEPSGKGLLYLHPSGKAAEAPEGGEIERLVNNGFTVLAPDLVGIGEMGGGDVANYTTQFRDFDETSFDVWPASVLIGRSIVGIQAGDVVRLTQLLRREYAPDEVYGVARREMAPVLLHAAAFEENISQIALIEPYASYRSIVMNRFYDPGFHLSTVAGSLQAYDLPDLAASLAPRRLLMVGVTDGGGNATDAAAIEEDMSVIETAYQYEDADEQLRITLGEGETKLADLLLEWLE